ncbi:MAG: hypothetical protein U0350_48925 [Caldilineaceae bacterium]
MATETQQNPSKPTRPRLAADWWPVLVSLVLALLLYIGILPNVPW